MLIKNLIKELQEEEDQDKRVIIGISGNDEEGIIYYGISMVANIDGNCIIFDSIRTSLEKKEEK